MIKDKIQSKVGKAFSAKLSDAVTAFTCTKIIKSGEYNFITESYAESKTEAYSGRGVFGSYFRDLVKPVNYQAEDIKAIVLQNEVDAVPQIGDEWSAWGGIFKVLNVESDAASVCWRVHLRKTTT